MINELRIGNIILLNGEIVKVDLDFFKKYSEKNKLIGLKLTEKMLIDLNYRKQENTEWNGKREIKAEPYYFDTQLPYYAPNRTSGIYVRNKKLYVLGGYIYNELKYLHQLQNVFFTTTGDELIITDVILNGTA